MVHAVPDILARIVGRKRAELGQLLTRRAELERRAAARSEVRNFREALRAHRPAFIAEIKKASPSKGVLARDFEPAGIAREYQRGGAAALSVLTDTEFFEGRLADLEAARAAANLPVLRKDFTIGEIHVLEAAAHGADAILLIAAILEDSELRRFRELAAGYGMAALVEVHDSGELRRALASGAEIVGVNNRDLRTFQVSLETSLDLADKIPSGVLKVSESGIRRREDVERLQAAGYQAFLVGEHLMSAPNREEALRVLRPILVKICGITRREDAEAAVEAGATAIGFVFHEGSPRNVTPKLAAEIGAGLPVWRVGVFVDKPAAFVRETMRTAELDIAQMYGGEIPEGIRVWPAYRVAEGINAAPFAGQEVLLDGPANGVPFDWTRVRGAAPKVILAGGLDASNVAEAIRVARPWGVDASSRLESAPGIKDHEKVRRFIQAARQATP
jgi:indole-3-glycerol phosphate synthase